MGKAAPPPDPPAGRVVGRVVGALFMPVLFVVAIDMTTTILWMIGLWVFVGAIRAAVRELMGKRSVAVVAACLASIVLFPASCVAQFTATSATMRRVHTLADQAQTRCDAAGICPDVVTLCGGTVEAARSHNGRVAGQCGTAGTTVRFPVHYNLLDDGRRFSVSARLNIDLSVSSFGGVGLPLQRGTISDGVEEIETVRPASTPTPPSATTTTP